ncbi:glycosyltransferase family 4 protein [Luteimicrobium subarcticum]|uniref:Glycosyltransferase involved in cell wall biosynthesis n=1 Tax=Luteimicrobium subarcticum TaxID=620910 RepID=A0A2M8WT65_9MICO|nr:glycosyltransferase family 1 protein [Luteimicrobium subarcticum]PJI94123.1 glycosyltransferase involved in cell wall biosynthesis [Luteimicrobium subarcticum]
MTRLVIARSAAAHPMGAQRYESEVETRAAALLPGWRVDVSVSRSLRSDLPGTRRLPFGWLSSASVEERRLVGRLLHSRQSVLHRMDLAIPPAPQGDVVTIHDTVAWRYPDESAPVRAAADEARRAAAVVCVSEFSADEVRSLLGVAEPRVVYNGVDDAYFDAPPLGTDVRRALGLEGPYVLHAGGASQRKNLGELAAAWELASPSLSGITLALAGPEHPTRTRLFAPLQRTVLLGRQPDRLMPSIVASAEAVVVPSTYEGFGLPALEAMAAGTPVIVSNCSALPEVVGDCGFVVEPRREALASALLAVTVDPDAGLAARLDRARARARRFTWEATARAHADIWREVAG